MTCLVVILFGLLQALYPNRLFHEQNIVKENHQHFNLIIDKKLLFPNIHI